MKHFVAVQQLRVAAIATHTLQAISQFIALVEADCDEQKRTKSPLQQRCGWLQFVLANKNTPLFRRYLRMTYNSFMKDNDDPTMLPTIASDAVVHSQTRHAHATEIQETPSVTIDINEIRI